MNAKDQRFGTEIAHGAEDGIKDGMNNQLTIVFFNACGYCQDRVLCQEVLWLTVQ